MITWAICWLLKGVDAGEGVAILLIFAMLCDVLCATAFSYCIERIRK